MENGVRVVITTQVPHEGSNLSVYRVGHIIKEKYRVLEASNMTTEAVIAKMCGHWPIPRPARNLKSSSAPL